MAIEGASVEGAGLLATLYECIGSLNDEKGALLRGNVVAWLIRMTSAQRFHHRRPYSQAGK